jgi:GNAT superfamily N-acetyltransferase
MESRDAVTYLLLDGPADAELIAGYFCLAAGSIAREAAPTSLAGRAPDPVPAVHMGRFAIDRSRQGQGWGAELLREALLGAVSGGKLIGARILLVDAISDEARDFSMRFGFVPSPIHPLQVMYDLRIVEASMGGSKGT